jgi:hypothetical protein
MIRQLLTLQMYGFADVGLIWVGLRVISVTAHLNAMGQS